MKEPWDFLEKQYYLLLKYKHENVNEIIVKKENDQ